MQPTSVAGPFGRLVAASYHEAVRPFVLGVLILSAFACGDDAEGGAEDATVPMDSALADAFLWPDVDVVVDDPATSMRGLILLAQELQPTVSPHLVEIVPHGDVAYVANSNDQFGAWLLEPEGTMLATLPRPPPSELYRRCTTLAIHAASNTLFCSADDAQVVLTFDLTEPQVPVLRDPEAVVYPELFTRDITVVGDRLYYARFQKGLAYSEIAPDGSLGPVTPTLVDEDMRFVEGTDPLIALGARGLMVLGGSDADIEVRETLPLRGPRLGLRVVGDRALVALGSFGVAIVDVAGGAPMLERVIEVPGVVTAADLSGDALAVSTLIGAFLYDLRQTPPRVAGFAPAGRRGPRSEGVMLHAAFAGPDLLVSDWSFVERYAIDLEGAVVDVDHVRGLYLAPGQDAGIPLRNVGDQTMEVRVRAGRGGDERSPPPRRDREGDDPGRHHRDPRRGGRNPGGHGDFDRRGVGGREPDSRRGATRGDRRRVSTGPWRSFSTRRDRRRQPASPAPAHGGRAAAPRLVHDGLRRDVARD